MAAQPSARLRVYDLYSIDRGSGRRVCVMFDAPVPSRVVFNWEASAGRRGMYIERGTTGA